RLGVDVDEEGILARVRRIHRCIECVLAGGGDGERVGRRAARGIDATGGSVLLDRSAGEVEGRGEDARARLKGGSRRASAAVGSTARAGLLIVADTVPADGV